MFKRGVTLLELLISLGILAIVAMMIGSVFSGFSRTGKLIEAHSGLVGVLRDAKSRTLASESSSNYGVHFEVNKAVLFRGDVYNSADPLNEEYLLSTHVQISAISLTGGANDVVFTRLLGTTTASGTVTVSSTNDPSQIRTVTVLSAGGIQ